MSWIFFLVLVPAALVSADESPVATQSLQEQKSNGVKRQVSGAPLGFAYSVDDPVTGNNYGRQESSNGSAVSGQYFVRLPNGDLQIVNYTASAEKGYVANVYTQVNPAGAASLKPGQQVSVSSGGSSWKPASTVAAEPGASYSVASGSGKLASTVAAEPSASYSVAGGSGKLASTVAAEPGASYSVASGSWKPASTVAASPSVTTSVAREVALAAQLNQNNENANVAVTGDQVASAIVGSGEPTSLQLIPLEVEGSPTDYAQSYTGGLENVLVPFNSEYQQFYGYPQENSVFLLTNQPDCADKVQENNVVLVYQNEYYPDAIQQQDENTVTVLEEEENATTTTMITKTLTKTTTAAPTTTKTTTVPTTTTTTTNPTTATTTIAPKSETTTAAPTKTVPTTTSTTAPSTTTTATPTTTTAAPTTTTAAPTTTTAAPTTTTAAPTTTTAAPTTTTAAPTTTTAATVPTTTTAKRTVSTTTSAPETTTTKTAPITTETTKIPMMTTAAPTETSFFQVVTENQVQREAQESLGNQQYIPSSQYIFLIPAQNDYLHAPYVYQPQPIFLNSNTGSEFQTNVQLNALSGVLPSSSLSASSASSANQPMNFVEDSAATQATVTAVPAVSETSVPLVELPSVAVNLPQTTAASVSPVSITTTPASVPVSSVSVTTTAASVPVSSVSVTTNPAGSTSTTSVPVSQTTKPSLITVPVFETGFEPMEGPFQSVMLEVASTSTAAPIVASSQPQLQVSNISQSSTTNDLESLELVTPPSVPAIDEAPLPGTAAIIQNQTVPLVPLPQVTVQEIPVIQPAKSYGIPVSSYGSSSGLPVPVYGAAVAVQPSQTNVMPPASSYGAPVEPSRPVYGAASLPTRPVDGASKSALRPQSYGAPVVPPPVASYPAPAPVYGAPAKQPPATSYPVPVPVYGVSVQQPAASYAVPTQVYGAPPKQPPVASYPVPAALYGAAPISYGTPSYSYKPSVQKPIPFPVPLQMKPYGVMLPQPHHTKGKGQGVAPSGKWPAMPLQGGKQVVIYKPVISKKSRQLMLKPELGNHPPGRSTEGVKYRTIGKLKFDTPAIGGKNGY